MNKQPLLFSALAVVGGLCLPMAAGAQTQPTVAPRAVLGAHLGATSIAGGDYEQLASLWGYGSFGTGLVANLEAGAMVTPWLTVGGRLGMLRSTSESSGRDGASLSLSSYDLGAFARFGAVLGQRRVKGFVGAQLEAGAQYASIALRGASESAIAPRFAVLAMGQMIVGPVAFGLRIGPRFGAWSRAGGQDADLDLGGIEVSTGVEVRL